MSSQSPSPSKLPIVAAAIAGLLLIFGVRAITSRDSADSDDGDGVTPRAGCAVITMAASSEKAALLRDVAADYQKADRKVNGRCADVDVFTKASGGAMDALARGWDEAVDGKRPDVWSPASSSWAVLLRQRTSERDAPDLLSVDNIKDIPSVAQTPLVLAMPRPMAEALGWPRKALGWSDVLELSRDPAGWGKYNRPEWGKFRLGKTNPHFSTSGLNATVAAYFAATGLASDLSPANVNDPKTQAYVKEVEQAVVHYGDTTLTFLENMQRADDRGQGLSYISAVTIEEKSVWDYNRGNPTGDPKTLGNHPPPAVPLVAVYPKEGTLVSDNPYVVLRAPWVDDEKRSVADDFLKFLQSPEQQRRFQAAAFRDFAGKPGGEINQENGMIPAQPTTRLSPPAPPVLHLVLQTWSSLRKAARVLLVMDVSGSMGEERKLELAKTAAIRSLDQFAPTDEVGLWIFSTNLDRGRPHLELVPVGSMRENRRALESRIRTLVPNGGTALYATTRAAAQFMRERFAADRINAVLLLTDGKNEYPQDTDVESLVRGLEGESEDTTIRVFTIGYGSDADFDVLRRISAASRARAYDASDPATIERVFTEVVSNF